MVLVDLTSSVNSCMVFEAVLKVLGNSQIMYKGIQGTVHCGYVCQTAVVTDVDPQVQYQLKIPL